MRVNGDIDGGERLPSQFGHFIFWKSDPGTHGIKRFDRVQIGSGRFGRKCLFPTGKISLNKE
jgi:hypothetical protein